MAVTDETHVRAMVEAQGSGWLVTAADGAPTATLMPIIWRGTRLVAHLAKANPHWRSIGDGTSGLMIVGGPEAYVSPSWYASKSEHGRVVPTWNYLAVQLAGPVRVHHDPRWLRDVVTHLTDLHEGRRQDPWHVSDAPEEYIDKMLHSIVGVEMTVEHIDAKAKLSQNRPEPDQLGVIEGLDSLESPGAGTIAAAMRRRLTQTG